MDLIFVILSLESVLSRFCLSKCQFDLGQKPQDTREIKAYTSNIRTAIKKRELKRNKNPNIAAKLELSQKAKTVFLTLKITIFPSIY